MNKLPIDILVFASCACLLTFSFTQGMEQEFMRAINNADLTKVQQLIPSIKNINQPVSVINRTSGAQIMLTPLQVLASGLWKDYSENAEKIAFLLVLKGADINKGNSDEKDKPLELALKYHCQDLYFIQKLVDLGAATKIALTQLESLPDICKSKEYEITRILTMEKPYERPENGMYVPKVTSERQP